MVIVVVAVLECGGCRGALAVMVTVVGVRDGDRGGGRWWVWRGGASIVRGGGGDVLEVVKVCLAPMSIIFSMGLDR